MRQLTECYWIAVVEDGDTPETVAHWIEDNLETALPRGSINTEMWSLDPLPGDYIIFDAPAFVAMQRYPNPIRELPVPHTELQASMTEELFPQDEKKGLRDYLANLKYYVGLAWAMRKKEDKSE